MFLMEVARIWLAGPAFREIHCFPPACILSEKLAPVLTYSSSGQES